MGSLLEQLKGTLVELFLGNNGGDQLWAKWGLLKGWLLVAEGELEWSLSSLWDLTAFTAAGGGGLLVVVSVDLLSLLLALLLLLPLLLGLSSELATLVVQVEFVNQALDLVFVGSLGLHFRGGWVGAGLLLLLKGDVLHNEAINVLLRAKAIDETFLLVDFNDGEVLAAGTASKEAGVDNVVPEGSAAVISGPAVKEFWGHHGSEDWTVLAGGEVDGLLNVVDLVLIATVFFEG